MAGPQKGAKFILNQEAADRYESHATFLSFQSYRDYHADIFPDTTGLFSAMGPADWFEDKLDAAPAKISLDPKKRPKEVLTVFQVRRPIR